MPIESGDFIEAMFTVHDSHPSSTGVLVNADALPTAVLYINGSATGVTLIVSNIATGLYSVGGNLPAISRGDWMKIVATWVHSGDGPYGRVVWELFKEFEAGAIPNASAGSQDGLMVAGTNECFWQVTNGTIL